jgi:apolipoprotein D and lipocalin family protein
MRVPAILVMLSCVLVTLGGCRTMTPQTPLTTAPSVDLPRFMGDWYVIASIPTRLERGAHNAVESYRLAPDGRILVNFTFRAGSFDGRLKRYQPVGFVRDRRTNAVWGMRFVWPIKADYRIVYVDDAYSVTIIAREARDYVWIMARTPTIPQQQLEQLTRLVAGQGYDTRKLVRVPQRWP